MNLPFIKPVYDSLLRGKDLMFSADLSFLSKTFSYENTFSYDGKLSTENPRTPLASADYTSPAFFPFTGYSHQPSFQEHLIREVESLPKDKYNTNFIHLMM